MMTYLQSLEIKYASDPVTLRSMAESEFGIGGFDEIGEWIVPPRIEGLHP